MAYRIKSLSEFKATVFGADDLLMYFPELTTSGVNLVEQNNSYYIADSDNKPVSDSVFFSKAEMSCLEQI